MREILFRGKRLDVRDWEYGDLSQHKDGRMHIRSWNGVPSMSSYQAYEVDPSTVGQYTGLQDKNGKRIFEGDIIKIAQRSDGLGTYFHPPIEYPANAVVEWDLCSWEWKTCGYHIHFPEAWCHFESEVIGNIHDNPQMLMGGNEHPQFEKQEEEAEKDSLPWYLGLFNSEFFKAAAEGKE